MINDAVNEAAARIQDAGSGDLQRLQVRIPKDLYWDLHRFASDRKGTSPSSVVAEGIRLVLDATARTAREIVEALEDGS